MNKTVSFIILIALVSCFHGNIIAQVPGNSNSFSVTEIVSPVAYFNYKLNDSSDFIIEVRNQGPNSVIAGDILNISYNIFGESGSNSQSYDTSITVGKTMPVGAIIRYTLHKNIDLGGTGEGFTACADISGSFIYPVNTNKFPGKCAPFAVSLSEKALSLNEVYYANGQLFFSLKSNESVIAEVFDITGKSIKKIRLAKTSNQGFPLNIPVNGFYFMKVYSNSGTAATVKFVVNQ